GATLTNATATTGSSGAAPFSGLAISGPTGTYTLSFAATGLTAVTSSGITLGAGAAATIAENGGNGQSAPAGTAVATPPSVIVRDGAGNPVSGVAVSFAVTSGGGTVSFSGLTLSGTVGSYTLRFEDTNLTPATSSAIALSAGAAATITLNGGDGQSATVGTAVATPPSVLVHDGAGNPVADVTVTFTVTSGGGTVSPTSGAADDRCVAAVTSEMLWTTLVA